MVYGATPQKVIAGVEVLRGRETFRIQNVSQALTLPERGRAGLLKADFNRPARKAVSTAARPRDIPYSITSGVLIPHHLGFQDSRWEGEQEQKQRTKAKANECRTSA